MSARPSAHARVYAALVGLYPGDFRRQYRTDLVQLFRDDLRDRGALRAWARSLADLSISAPTEHLEAHMSQSASPPATIAASVVALAAVLTAVAFLHAIVLTLPLAFGAVAYALHRKAAMPYREAIPSASSTWYRFVLGGAAILASLALGSSFGPDWLALPWFLLVMAFLLGWVFIGTGALLAFVALVRHFMARHPAV